MPEKTYPIRKNNWDNIFFFSVTALVGLIGTPWYFLKYGVAGSEIAFFVLFLVITPLSITVGYHRLFAHATYKTNAVVRFILLFFGAAAFQQSALEWSSQHKDHHRYVDTDRDPYSIKRGFFYAHIGWVLFWQHETDYDNVNRLKNDALIMHQHRYYLLWAILAGIVTPLFLGVLTGHLLGAFILSVCLRLSMVSHLTFFINSICHMFGRSTYDIYATARDNWLIAFLTFGEGYHNFSPSVCRRLSQWRALVSMGSKQMDYCASGKNWPGLGYEASFEFQHPCSSVSWRKQACVRLAGSGRKEYRVLKWRSEIAIRQSPAKSCQLGRSGQGLPRGSATAGRSLLGRSTRYRHAGNWQRRATNSD